MLKRRAFNAAMQVNGVEGYSLNKSMSRNISIRIAYSSDDGEPWVEPGRDASCRFTVHSNVFPNDGKNMPVAATKGLGPRHSPLRRQVYSE